MSTSGSKSSKGFSPTKRIRTPDQALKRKSNRELLRAHQETKDRERENAARREIRVCVNQWKREHVTMLQEEK